MEDHLHDQNPHQQQQNQQQQYQQELKLPPGFRFYPKDVEIITSYLFPKVLDRNFIAYAMGEVDLSKCEPWELPEKAKMGEKEWYFYSQKDRKYATGIRINRATESGYWKATGKDKEIFVPPPSILVGVKKTLVFYKGRAPRGEKTNWVMHEYRIETRKEEMPYATNSGADIINVASKDKWVVCRIFRKGSAGTKKVMPSNDMAAMPMSMGDHQQQQQHHHHQSSVDIDSGTACSFPPLMDYDMPPSPLATSPSQLYADGAGTSMLGVPTMNEYYFGNGSQHQMMEPPPSPMSLYEQQMQMMDQGFMAGGLFSMAASQEDAGTGLLSMVSEEDAGTGLSNNDQCNGAAAAAEIPSVYMGMDDIWNYI